MDIPRIDQCLDELTFHLYNRPLHPELFNIFSSRQFFQGDYEVNIWMVGCSHVISVFHEKDCLTELICSPEQMLPERGLRRSFPFRGERAYRCRWGKGFSYLLSFQVENMSPNLYLQTHADLVGMAKKRGIMVPFPQLTIGDLMPFSYLDYEAHVQELRVHAFHAFPERHTVIKSQSLFKFRD